ncbi:MAG: hypothetical protein RQ966_05945 [Acetobacteraceae bacterium]|nr:hypothetical protein [Acetobacteraceae bacterium]
MSRNDLLLLIAGATVAAFLADNPGSVSRSSSMLVANLTATASSSAPWADVQPIAAAPR